ncbi:hypothetical protein TcCL_NonESM10192 [Trypanosoma cruzi]|nr:hypothetical protein TcCL_NonESM10192 [Trypanosoma cruzi]
MALGVAETRRRAGAYKYCCFRFWQYFHGTNQKWQKHPPQHAFVRRVRFSLLGRAVLLPGRRAAYKQPRRGVRNDSLNSPDGFCASREGIFWLADPTADRGKGFGKALRCDFSDSFWRS